MPKLVCQSGPNAGHEYTIAKDLVVLGRQSSCDVQIVDTMASRAHCHIRRDGRLWSVVDLGSRNGTLLNDRKVTERMLTFGDRIRVGQVEYVFIKASGDAELKDLLTKYDVDEKLGEGGMGIVYKAVQRSMARTVALKILAPKYTTRPKFVEQFIREARAAGQLNHPNIIQVHDVGSENDIHYFSMEFIDGSTCMQLLRADGPFQVNEALEICRQVARALDYAHQHRLIHQDIKPDNIMIGPGNLVKLADLGISKTFDEAEKEGEGKKVMGTPHYMAPEAGLGKKIDHRVDIYSLGATLYHLVTGKTPYHGTNATEVLRAHVMDPLPPLQDLNPEVSDDVCALVERMMAKKPEERYQSATEVVGEIERLQGGSTLGRERIPGHETMILRRFASGKAASPPGTMAGMPTTGDHTPEARNAVAAAEPGWARLIGWLLAAVAVLLVGIAAVMLWPKPATPTDSGTIAIPPPPVPGERPTRDTQPDPLAEIERRDAAQIAALADRLRREGDAADPREIGAQLADISARALTPANRQRADELRGRLEDLVRRKRIEAERTAVGELETESGRLVAERNWDLALRRIEAFRGREDGQTAGRLDRMREGVEADRRQYLGLLEQKIKAAQDQRSIPRLRELRDQLPKALLGGEVEKRLDAAITALEDGQRSALAGEVPLAGADLVRWDFAKVIDRHQRIRASLGDTEAGRLLDAYEQAARRLPAMVDAIAAEAKRGRIRIRGALAGWQDPDIDGASARALTLLVANGGNVELAWAKLSPVEVGLVGQSALRDGYEAFKPIVATLAAARVGSEK
jgi:hypothetical protein